MTHGPAFLQFLSWWRDNQMIHREREHQKENCQVTDIDPILNESLISPSKQIRKQQKAEKAEWYMKNCVCEYTQIAKVAKELQNKF